MLSSLRLNLTQSSIGNFFELMKISVKIEDQTNKENPHHTDASFNLLLIQLRSLLANQKQKRKKERGYGENVWLAISPILRGFKSPPVHFNMLFNDSRSSVGK